jgi:LPPG:FO 2-phospho-L-lactate transferase
MIAFFSGGTGTPKLLRGVRTLVPDEEIAVVVNTAEDVWMSGNHLAPDLDTVMYLFAGVLDTDRWWGQKEDTFVTHEAACVIGADEYIAIGDRDRAIHIRRAEMLRKGLTLTEATRALCGTLGVSARILPMADTPVASMVETIEGWIHFQEYWVRKHGAIGITSVERRWEAPPKATDAVKKVLKECEGVVIGPSNPVTSILPILECEGIVPSLKQKPVIAISPFVGSEPVSGPTAALMKAKNIEPSSRGIHLLYREFVDLFVQDHRDVTPVPGTIRLDTLMTGPPESARLAKQVIELLRETIRR